MPLLPEAEPFRHTGGRVGAVLCHGFTGTPQSLRPWAERLAAAGLTVELPLLPGHGTRWQDMAATTCEDWSAAVDEAFARASRACDSVFVMGLSMGGCLALRLAQRHPDGVAGVVVVNPSLAVEDRLLYLGHVAKLFLPSVAGLAGDVRRPGVREVAYDRVPVAAAATLPRLWRATRRRLDAITAPILAYRSREDHVVGPTSLRILERGAVNSSLTVRTLDNSYHVATLDNDAETIFDGSLAFVREHSASGEGAGHD